MIKMYVMQSCPDCTDAEEQLGANPAVEIIDIGSHVRHLKAFIRLRDSHPAFAQARKEGFLGIPCFVLDDGTVTLNPADVGIKPREQVGESCSLTNRSGC